MSERPAHLAPSSDAGPTAAACVPATDDAARAAVNDGKALAATIIDRVRDELATLASHRLRPRLAAVLAGDAQASYIYTENQRKRCAELGIDYDLVHLDNTQLDALGSPAAIQSRLLGEIRRLNADLNVTGVMLHLPLPAGVSATRLQFEIDPFKDVEGVNPANLGFIFYQDPILLPCTALAVVELIRHGGVSLRGANVCVVGQSGIVGRPISALLVQEGATVMSCHQYTRDVGHFTRQAEVVVVAVGKPNLLRADMLRRGVCVIDVGINRVAVSGPDGTTTRKTVGDCADDVWSVAQSVTPVPGGVGPVTVAMLMRNVVEAVRKQRARGLQGPD